MTLLTDPFEEEQFIAGEYVAWGIYQQVGTKIRYEFDTAGYLPLSAEGAICSYFRVSDMEAIAERAAALGDSVPGASAA
jgi:hypothetical protein